MARRFRDFDEFWPFYVGEHRNRACRALHIAGTLLGAATFAYALATATWWMVPMAFVIGYGSAWVGHFVFERNKPAAFGNPLWSFRGDWKLIGLFLRGRLSEEITRLYGSPNPSPDAPLRTEA